MTKIASRKDRPDTNRATRRSALRAVSGIAGASMILPVVGSTTGAAKSTRTFVGTSYDTLTHRAQGRTVAQLTFEQNRLSGQFELPGLRIPIGEETPLEPYRVRSGERLYKVTKDNSRLTRDGLPLKVHLKAVNNQILGNITRPGGDYGKLAFSIGEPKADFSADFVKQSLINQGQGIAPVGFEEVPSVPSSGVPTSTAPTKTTKSPK